MHTLKTRRLTDHLFRLLPCSYSNEVTILDRDEVVDVINSLGNIIWDMFPGVQLYIVEGNDG